MLTVCVNHSVLEMKDLLAPYRGTWMVYGADHHKGDPVWDETGAESLAVKQLERPSLATLEVVSALAAQLFAHGRPATHALVL